jgi:hypothetical protein
MKYQLISHHKSGVLVTLYIFKQLCCPRVPFRDFPTWWARPNGNYYKCLKETCNVSWNVDGFHSHMKNDTLYVHIIRNPIDMVVSGYLYHKNCIEKWTKTTKLDRARFPPHFSLQEPYCKHLNHVGEEEGLMLEMNRSLFSTLNNMFELQHENVRDVCIENVVESINTIFDKNISIPMFKSHMTNSSVDTRMHNYVRTNFPHRKYIHLCKQNAR